MTSRFTRLLPPSNPGRPLPRSLRPAVSPPPSPPSADDIADAVDPVIDESPYSRLITLIMSCLFFVVPVAGLQRISVGRIKSGLLWMVTFGLFGIGQIYDTIMIALGHFRDVDGKRVLHFTKKKVQAMQEPVNQYSAVVPSAMDRVANRIQARQSGFQSVRSVPADGCSGVGGYWSRLTSRLQWQRVRSERKCVTSSFVQPASKTGT